MIIRMTKAATSCLFLCDLSSDRRALRTVKKSNCIRMTMQIDFVLETTAATVQKLRSKIGKCVPAAVLGKSNCIPMQIDFCMTPAQGCWQKYFEDC